MDISNIGPFTLLGMGVKLYLKRSEWEEQEIVNKFV